MNDTDVHPIVIRLRDPNGPDIVRVGSVVPEVLAHWPDRVTNDIAITRRQRDHYLNQHPEMIDYEVDLVRTLLNPDEVHSVKGSGFTAVLYGKQDAMHDVVAIVRISTSSDLRNSVITARRQYAKRKLRPAEARRKVWSK